MRVQKYAFAKFRQLHESGIPVYVVYGSHDFSPVSDSVIDLLATAGYITKTVAEGNDDGTISLDFITDGKTGAKITGLSGLKAGKDIEYYAKSRPDANRIRTWIQDIPVPRGNRRDEERQHQ